MGIIINDFEILLDPPPQSSGSQQNQPSEEQQPAQTPALSPQDIERIIRHFDERRNRLQAD
jgi:hypothetical protein